MTQNPHIPIKTLHLFPVLDKLLIELLKSLSTEEWNLPTIAKLWTVKDIAAHLLDGNLRALSTSRDNYFADAPATINSYAELVQYLNGLNSTWVNVAKRISTTVLTELLELTGKQYTAHLQTLNPFDTALFSVAWAGQEKSENWFHTAREYTEKFIHQQQIREAVGRQALFTKELFYPFMNTFMYGLPHVYRTIHAGTGTTVTVKILSDIGGEWMITKMETAWVLTEVNSVSSAATVCMSPDTAWKLFSKGITPQEAFSKIEITGEKKLGETVLQMVSVMA